MLARRLITRWTLRSENQFSVAWRQKQPRWLVLHNCHFATGHKCSVGAAAPNGCLRGTRSSPSPLKRRKEKEPTENVLAVSQLPIQPGHIGARRPESMDALHLLSIVARYWILLRNPLPAPSTAERPLFVYFLITGNPLWVQVREVCIVHANCAVSTTEFEVGSTVLFKTFFVHIHTVKLSPVTPE